MAAAAAGIICLLVYLPALSCGFINLDDPFYITTNPLIKSLDITSLARIFTGAHLGAWLPLTYVSFALDYHLWGNDPFGYHLTNIVLHALNTALLVLLANRCCRSRFPAGGGDVGGWLYPGMLLLAGLLFGLHPLRVESVAWAAERKDVLNGFFTIAAVLAYGRFVELKDAGGAASKWRTAYVASVLLFCLSLLAKQVSVTLPVILLLLDWYPFNRLSRERLLPLLVEKIPFLVLSLLVTAITIYFAVADKMLLSMNSMPFLVRMVISGNAVFEYCRLTLFPVGIAPFFPLAKPLPFGYMVKAAVVIMVTIFIGRAMRSHRGPAMIWACFVVMLAPMLAFVQVNDGTAMAARYTYLPAIAPTIGLAVAITVCLRQWLVQERRPPAIAGLCLVILVLFLSGFATNRLIKVWQDTGTFWTRVIDINPVGRAYADRGVFYLIKGKSSEAEKDFSNAISLAMDAGLTPEYNLYAFRGVALSDLGRFAEAVGDFDKAIEIHPHRTYYQLRGNSLKTLGRTIEAEMDFLRAGPNPPPIDWF